MKSARLRVAATLLLAALAAAAWTWHAQRAPARSPAEPGASTPREYIGATACGGCHEKAFAAWQAAGFPMALVSGRRDIMRSSSLMPRPLFHASASKAHGSEAAA